MYTVTQTAFVSIPSQLKLKRMIPVAQEILRIMELKKTVITFDALHTKRNM